MSGKPGESSSQGTSEEALPRFLESKPVKKAGLENPGTGKKIILAVLLLMLVWMTLQMFLFSKKIKKVQTSAKNSPAPMVMPQAAPLPAAPEVEEDHSGARSSPFSMEPAAAIPEAFVPVRGPVLQGVLMDGRGEAMAVINEKIVKKGERVADNLVKEILSDSVLLQKDSGEEQTLRMKS